MTKARRTMKFYKIELPQDYAVPENIEKVTADEWGIILQFVSDVYSKHDSISCDLNMSDEFKRNKEELLNVIKIKEDALIKIKEELSIVELKRDLIINEKLQKQKEEIDKNYKLNLHEIENEYKQRLLSREEHIATLNEKLYNNHLTTNEKFTAKLNELNEKNEKDKDIMRKDQLEYLSKAREMMQTEYLDKINEYKQSYLDNLAIEKELITKQIEQNYKHIITVKDINISTQEKEIAHINNHIKILNDRIEFYKESLMQTDNNNKSFKYIMEQLEPLQKLTSASTVEKGNAGEDMIYHTLRNDNKYKDAIIKKTRGETARGDLYINWRQLKCMFEIKNKQTITKEDIIKFERDITEMKMSNYNINCAIFISLNTNLIPDKTMDDLRFDVVDGVPVAYIYYTDPSIIYITLLCLSKLTALNSSTTQQSIILVEYFKRQYIDVVEMINYLNKIIITKRKEIDQASKMQKKYTDVLTNIKLDYPSIVGVNIEQETSLEIINKPITPTIQSVKIQVPNSTTSINTVSTIDDNINTNYNKWQLDNIHGAADLFMSTYFDILKRNSGNVSKREVLSICEINESDLTILGGYTKLTKQVADKYIDSMLTFTVIKFIMNYKQLNSAYPTRDVLLKHKTFTKEQLSMYSKLYPSYKPHYPIGKKTTIKLIIEDCEERFEKLNSKNERKDNITHDELEPVVEYDVEPEEEFNPESIDWDAIPDTPDIIDPRGTFTNDKFNKVKVSPTAKPEVKPEVKVNVETEVKVNVKPVGKPKPTTKQLPKKKTQVPIDEPSYE